jgi:hypothetical protein
MSNSRASTDRIEQEKEQIQQECVAVQRQKHTLSYLP